MEIYLDQRTMTPSENAATLGEVIDEARAEAAKGDRVIVGIRCDGVDITEGDLEARLAEPANTYNRDANSCFQVPETSDYIPVFWRCGSGQPYSIYFAKVIVDSSPIDTIPPGPVTDLDAAP